MKSLIFFLLAGESLYKIELLDGWMPFRPSAGWQTNEFLFSLAEIFSHGRKFNPFLTIRKMSAVETPGTIAFLEENLVSLYSINLLSADVPLLEQNVNNNKTFFFLLFLSFLPHTTYLFRLHWISRQWLLKVSWYIFHSPMNYWKHSCSMWGPILSLRCVAPSHQPNDKIQPGKWIVETVCRSQSTNVRHA